MRKDYLPFGKPNFSEEEISAVSEILRSGWVGMGMQTITFEKELAEYLCAPFVVSVNSCTSALFLALLVSGVKEGDEVICPSLTWCSTANAALYLGASPVFCDVDKVTLCPSTDDILHKVTKKTKAVVTVHYGGLAVDVKQLRNVLPPDIVIIEDAAHALGTRYEDGSIVGSSGNLTCFSFYANKNLSTGEGGAIALFNEDNAKRLSSLRQHGLQTDAWMRFTNAKCLPSGALCELGYKMNYTDLQAAIGRVQLRRQREFHEIRLNIAKRYTATLVDVLRGVGFQSMILHENHARHLFVIVLPSEEMSLSRDEFILGLRDRNVGASIHYSPLHHMPLYTNMKDPNLPNTDWLCSRIVTLPMSASMTLEDADYVINQIGEIIKSR